MNRAQSKIAGLYTIVDRDFNPFDSMAELARRYLEGGVRIVQLRMKDASNASKASNASNVENEAREIMALKSEYDFTFIVNDYVDIALEVGADGVHVGENDEAIESIRERAGGKLIVGYSSHSKDEALAAEEQGADYVAFGAIFQTKTKGPGHPVQGIERLRDVAAALEVPLVAIGGICRGNVKDVLAAGADSVAMITALSQAADVTAETGWFIREIGCRE